MEEITGRKEDNLIKYSTPLPKIRQLPIDNFIDIILGEYFYAVHCHIPESLRRFGQYIQRRYQSNYTE